MQSQSQSQQRDDYSLAQRTQSPLASVLGAALLLSVKLLSERGSAPHCPCPGCLHRLRCLHHPRGPGGGRLSHRAGFRRRPAPRLRAPRHRAWERCPAGGFGVNSPACWRPGDPRPGGTHPSCWAAATHRRHRRHRLGPAVPACGPIRGPPPGSSCRSPQTRLRPTVARRRRGRRQSHAAGRRCPPATAGPPGWAASPTPSSAAAAGAS